MDVSKKQRAIIKGKLTVFTNFINEIDAKVKAGEIIDDVSAANIQRRLPLIEPLLDQFEMNLGNIYSEANEAEAELKELEDFQQKFFEATAKADCLLSKIIDTDRGLSSRGSPANSVANSIASSARSVKNSIKLPTIKLPKFDGKSENWLEFRDLYVSLIEENANLDEAQKFHYLKASLEGDAARVIESIKFSTTNYTLAWTRLQERYNSEKVLIHNHVKSLFNLESIQKESSMKIRNLLDSVSKHLANIKSLTSSETLGETLIIYLVTSKLDSMTMREWEKHTKKIDMPSFNHLYEFLKEKSDLLETVEAKQKHKNQETVKSRSLVTKQESCVVCKNSHAIWSCDSFLKLSVKDRQEKVKSLRICILCLKKGHFISSCQSKYLCNKCHKRHNTLLHEEVKIAPEDENSQLVAAFSANTAQVLLPTASVKVFGSCGKVRTAKVLLDSGSQSCFITSDLCKKLKIQTSKIDMTIIGISESESPVQMKCDVQIQSHYNSSELKLSCLVIDKITSSLPSHNINLSNINIPQNLKLADPAFHKPGNIEILIGASHFWNLLCIGQINLGHNLPTLQKSKFGWLVSGPISTSFAKQSRCNFSKINDVQNQLSRFWEIEKVSETRTLSLEEKACEAHYKQTTRREYDGRFVVSIPLKETADKLGDSFEQAKKRFLALERKLQNNQILKDRYHNFMSEYEKLGHMSIAQPKPNEASFYLPHHGVLKEESVSTKLRVVFDGSASSTSGFSLNDLQMVGPTIQPDLISILLWFRKGQYAISADIEKMYRQVLINPEQRQLQMILWRPDPTESIKQYNLNTVTYGTSSASFLAIRSLIQIGMENEISNPDIAKIIKNDFYVDDLLTSTDDLEKAKYLCNTLPKILATGCFALRKWISNEPEVLSGIKLSDKHPNVLNVGSNENIKTLGLMWSGKTDSLTFKISHSQQRKVTKRIILSETAQIFDPLGLLGACTISAKIVLQDLWREKLDWDESVSNALFERWSRFREQLPILNNLRVPRHAICKNPKRIEMHGFCDASTNAYGACIYIRSIDHNDEITTRLLCAKGKVAPIKPLTVPRLELCGAVMLTILGKVVYENLDITFDSCTYWSDSTIVLGWLKTSPSLLKTFVCNRVAEIQEIAPNIKWKHISTKTNPADLLSRGVTPNELLESNLWWHGPSWLSEDSTVWPISNESTPSLPEFKVVTKTHISTCSSSFDFDKYSDLSKMERIVAYCLRFKNNSLKPREEGLTGPLRAAEIKGAFFWFNKNCPKCVIH
ncbi:uncharacterized protein LOC116164833 [Photinus pyralis]|nr:uncharacterized protein LOC116164833 [Photinus pyralis]